MSVLDVWHKQFGLPDQTAQDGVWLRYFVEQHDGDAFSKIVQRHAAMVHAVCRRILGNAADAEDAAQAVFLILAKRAHTTRKTNDVGSWLLGVARRVALQALRQRRRREAREKRVPATSFERSTDLVAAQEAARLCDAELLKLPDRYRQALVLCCMEGLSKSLAARRLGWPEGTVVSCVSRGKKLLAHRLIRRGLLPAMAAAVLSTPAAQAIPASLGTVSTSAVALISGRSLASFALPGAILLFHKVQTTMSFQRRLVFMICSVCLVLVGPGMLLGWHLLNTPAEVVVGKEAVEQQDSGKPETAASSPKKPETDQERLQGRWKLVAMVSNEIQPGGGPFSTVALGSMLEFKGNEFIRLASDGSLVPNQKNTCRINDRVQPKELDVIHDNTYTTPGLYSLDTDTLVICTSQAANSRPIEISAARNGSSRIAIYRRVSTPGVPTAEEIKIAEEQMIAQVGNSLKSCLIAMHNYHNDYTKLPQPAIFEKDTGKPLLSWRVMLLPYLDQGELYKQFKLDEPWDSEHNKKLIPKMPAIFAHPGTKAASNFKTHYRVFVAPAKTPEGRKNLFAPVFSLSPTEKRTLEQLTLADGTSNTIAVVESTDAVIWTKPDEILIEHDEAPIPSLGAIPNKPYFVATHFDGANHLYKRTSSLVGNVVMKDAYFKLLRQMIGWKDGWHMDPSSIMVR